MVKHLAVCALVAAGLSAVGGQGGAERESTAVEVAPVTAETGTPSTSAGRAAATALVQAAATDDYVALVPARLLDTRPGTSTVDGQGAGSGITNPGGTLQLQVGGRGGLPGDAGAAVLNVTATDATGSGFLTVYPCGLPLPLASNVNYSAGRDAANAVLAPIGSGGRVCIYTGAAATHLVVDVAGQLPAAPLPVPVGSGGRSNDCVFAKADVPLRVAFCESFDVAEPNPLVRSGDLNSVLWGVSRTTPHTNLGQGVINRFYPATLLGCGAPQKVLPPNDVRICNGRLMEAFFDNGTQPTLALYPKQPFDIGGGRTGTVVFDVSADAESIHANWPEFWWTDKPVPAPHGHLSSQDPYARHSFGFSVAEQCAGNQVKVDKIMVTRNYAYQELPFTTVSCVTKGSATGALNHFELRVNTNRAEIWGTDAGSSAVKLLAYADNINLSFTRGLIWIEQVAYNACKFDTQCDHTLAWDNVGFDGPLTYRDLSFDVPDANVSAGDGGLDLGYKVGPGVNQTLPVNGVFRNQTPTGALVTFNWWPNEQPNMPSFRINGGAWHDVAWPYPENVLFTWRTMDVAIPVNEVRDGNNTIELKASADGVVANINIILIAGAPA